MSTEHQTTGVQAVVLAVVLVGASSVPGCIGSKDVVWPPHPQSTPQALIWEFPYPNLTIDVDYMEGWEPTHDHLGLLQDTIQKLTSKQEVELQESTEISVSGKDGEWTMRDLAELREKTYDGETELMGNPLDETVLQVLYVDGSDVDNPTSVGTYIETTLIIFIEKIRSYADQDASVPKPESVASAQERRVLVHELGHAFGLVNCGIPMLVDRETPYNPCHSSNEESVMSADGTNRVDDVQEFVHGGGEGLPYEFDGDDVADIMAYRVEGALVAPE